MSWAALVLLLLAVAVSPPAVSANPTDETPTDTGRTSDYALGKRAVEAKDWANAIQLLSRAQLQDHRNPDLENLLGYASLAPRRGLENRGVESQHHTGGP